MCGRFAINDRTNALIERLVDAHGLKVLRGLEAYLPSFDLHPTDDVPVILHSKREHAAVLATARWSLTPAWSPTLKTKFPTFNARTEGITQKATWKGAVPHSRCLIPAAGYYEWTGQMPHRTPRWISPEDGELMFAGLYSWWPDRTAAPDSTDRWTLTTTILTMESVPELVGIHDRNPVALPESLWWDWIDPEVVGDQTFIDHAVAAARPVLGSLTAERVAASD